MFRKFLIIAGIMVVPCSTLLADFTYEETSAITGGALAGMLKVVGVFSKQAREPIPGSSLRAGFIDVIQLVSEAFRKLEIPGQVAEAPAVRDLDALLQALRLLRLRLHRVDARRGLGRPDRLSR